MLINIHKSYLAKKFCKKILLTSCIFLALVLIINLIEEANFLKDQKVNFITPIILTLLNAPSLLKEMFPFIFLISTQFYFIELIENKEINTLKQFGFTHFNMIKFLFSVSFFIALMILIFFYPFASLLKNEYLKIKNKYAEDNKYLAVITKNGIWIKDTFNEKIVIINADKIQNKNLLNVSITEFDNQFMVKQNIIAEKSNITTSRWLLNNVVITDTNNFTNNYNEFIYESNFDYEKINTLFSDLSALTFLELLRLKKDYINAGYSINEINIELHKMYSTPFLLALMSIIATIIMIKNKFQKNILINLFIGIFFSVIIYYISQFSNLLGVNGKLPINLSVWFPVFILFILTIVGILKLNEE